MARRIITDGKEARHVSIVLPLKELTALDVLAARQLRHRSELVREGIRLVLQRYKSENGADLPVLSHAPKPGPARRW